MVQICTKFHLIHFIVISLIVFTWFEIISLKKLSEHHWFGVINGLRTVTAKRKSWSKWRKIRLQWAKVVRFEPVFEFVEKTCSFIEVYVSNHWRRSVNTTGCMTNLNMQIKCANKQKIGMCAKKTDKIRVKISKINGKKTTMDVARAAIQ